MRSSYAVYLIRFTDVNSVPISWNRLPNNFLWTFFDGQTEIKASEWNTDFARLQVDAEKGGERPVMDKKTINRLFGGWFSNPDTANNRLILFARDVRPTCSGVNVDMMHILEEIQMSLYAVDGGLNRMHV